MNIKTISSSAKLKEYFKKLILLEYPQNHYLL